MPKYVVRHGAMRQLGVFSTSRGETFNRTIRVIARTQRGLEAGEVLCEASETAVADLKRPSHGQILRRMSSQDELELRKMHDQERQEYDVCEKHIAGLTLDMKLVDIEHVFGGERVIVYYLSENRVDFRELVKVLAREFQTRIEMRQIGVRDEAKLLADYGDCGKPVCCNTHLSEMPPVSMKMAKLQRATLDPTKISGRCGRLKCCLRYEYDTYQELQRDLPPVGADVVTRNGRMRVLGQEILSGQILAQGEDGRRVLIDAGEVLSVIAKGADRKTSGSQGEGERKADGERKPERGASRGRRDAPKPARGKSDGGSPKDRPKEGGAPEKKSTAAGSTDSAAKDSAAKDSAAEESRPAESKSAEESPAENKPTDGPREQASPPSDTPSE